jgi:EmrB/QacA subfamily drug resistance transporter
VNWLKKIPYQWLVASVFVMALFMDILDITIVNVSLVAISKEFNVSVPDTTWVVLGYSLSLAVWIPVSGWVGERFGTKRTFLFALAMFAAASFLCGQSQSIKQLIAFRLLQGVGGGMLTPVGTTLLFRAFPPEQRARASTILTIPTVLAPASGPVLGGLLTDGPGWRWVFWVNLPIALIAFIVAAFGLKPDKPAQHRRFDGVGFALSVIGFPSLVFFLERGAEDGWLSGTEIIAFVLAVSALAGLVWWSRKTPQPMLDLGLLKERLFRTTNAVSFVSTMAFLGIVFLLPQFLQRVAGFSATQSGLATFPQAIGVILISRLTGRIYPRVGPRRMLTFAYTGLALMTVPFLFLTVDTNPWFIRAIMFSRGLFLAFTFIPLQAASYARITPEQTGRASAIYSTQRQLGAATGVAILSTILVGALPQAFPRGPMPANLVGGFTSAFHWAFVGAIVLTLAAAGMSLLIRDSDAAATVKQSR